MNGLLDRMIDNATAAGICGVSDTEMKAILERAKSAGLVQCNDRGEVRFGDVLSVMDGYKRDTSAEDARVARILRRAARAGKL